MKNKNHLIILITFLILILIPLPYWITRNGDWDRYSELEVRNLAQFPELDPASFLSIFSKQECSKNEPCLFNRSLQKAVDDALLDQFPLRLRIIQLARALDRVQIQIAYALLADTAIPADLDHDYLIMRGEQVFIQYPLPKSWVSLKTVNERIENYRQVIGNYPDIHFYIFYLERMTFAPYNPAADHFPGSDKRSSFNYFLENKPENLGVSALLLDNYQEFKERFFRTDHHWNARGAWEGYQRIYDMLAENYAEISPKLQLEEFRTIEGVEFCGSYARRTLVPCEPEPFEVALVDLPPYRSFIDGQEQPVGHRTEYLAGVFERELYTSHYAQYYGFVEDQITFEFDNGSDRNLLIIGNSYTQAVQLFIASHYHQTHIVNFRESSDFNLGEFLEAHEIDDILILGDILTYGRAEWALKG